MKKLIFCALLFLFSCQKSSVSTTDGTVIRQSYGNWVNIKNVCNGVERPGEPEYLFVGVTPVYSMYTRVNANCQIRSVGSVSWDQTTLSLTQTFAEYVPAGCDLAALPANHTLTGPATITPYNLTWTYTNLLSESCISTFYR